MSIIPLRAFQDNYIWAIVNNINHTLICVDPGEANPVLMYAKQNRQQLSHILLTHHHHDHIGGVEELLYHYPKTLVYGPNDSRITPIHITVQEGDVINIEALALHILSIPGHTRSHICYQELNNGWLFCGDTLFSAGCGRVFDGSIEQLHHSIMRLKQLPDDTRVYCGHEYTLQNLQFALTVEPNNKAIQSYIQKLQQQTDICTLPSTIRLEKKINPFFRTNSAIIKQFALRNGLTSNDSFAIFKLLRETKDIFR